MRASERIRRGGDVRSYAGDDVGKEIEKEERGVGRAIVVAAAFAKMGMCGESVSARERASEREVD